MGRKRGQKHIGTHGVFATVEREFKRQTLVSIANICGTSANQVGSVISDATLVDAYNDDGAERSTDTIERATASASSSDDPTV